MTATSTRAHTATSRSRRRRIHLLTQACILAALLCHSGPAQEKRAPKPNPLTREDVQRGISQFQQNCAMCHGTEAKGASGPNLVESSLVRHDQHGDLIAPLIHDGRLPRGMPAFPNLIPAQVADIVSFLHAIVEVSDNRGSGGTARGLALKNLLTGNAEAGKQFFQGPGHCAACHSPTDDLRGIAKKYTPLELEGRILYPSGQPKSATVTLPSGKQTSGQLLHLDPFYVALLDHQGEYRSWPIRPGVKVDVQDPLRAHRDLLERYADKDIHDLFAYLETLH
jgi:cytochrome c oxidase cbb3-type subunit 3